jgi:hypothetical protein
MTPTWLSVREGTTPLPALREGVPQSVESALRGWIWETASLDSEVAQHAMIRLDLVLPDAYWQRYQKELTERRAKQAALNAEWKAKQVARTEREAIAYSYVPSLQFLPLPADPQARFLARGTELENLWDIVDVLLHGLCIEPLGPDVPPLVALRKWTATRRTKRLTAPLRQLLDESRSVYEIRPDQRGLRRRMEVFLAEQVERAATSAEDAGYPQARKHLRRAGQAVRSAPRPERCLRRADPGGGGGRVPAVPARRSVADARQSSKPFARRGRQVRVRPL